MTALLIIIYILGFVATMLTIYHKLEKGSVITVSDIFTYTLISLFSWIGFIITFLVFYGNKKVFIKK